MTISEELARTRPVSDRKLRKQRKEANAADLASTFIWSLMATLFDGRVYLGAFENTNRTAIVEAVQAKQQQQREHAKAKVRRVQHGFPYCLLRLNEINKTWSTTKRRKSKPKRNEGKRHRKANGGAEAATNEV